jgi:polyhydroxyalkanoate synthesis regulator phasin
MEATMDPNAMPGANTAAADAAQPVIDALKGVGWFGLGLVALAVEGTGWLVKAAVEEGKKVAPSVTEPLKTAGDNVEEAIGEMGTCLKNMGQAAKKSATAMGHSMDERIAAAVRNAEAPVLAEMSALKAQIEELTAKIEGLRAKREQAE